MIIIFKDILLEDPMLKHHEKEKENFQILQNNLHPIINVLNILIKHNKERELYNLFVVYQNVIHIYYVENVNKKYSNVNMIKLLN